MNPRVARVVTAAATQYPAIVIAKDRHFRQPEKPRGRGAEVHADKDLGREKGRKSRTGQTSASALPCHGSMQGNGRRVPTPSLSYQGGRKGQGRSRPQCWWLPVPHTARGGQALSRSGWIRTRSQMRSRQGRRLQQGRAPARMHRRAAGRVRGERTTHRPEGRPERCHDCRRFHIQRRVSTRKGINRYPHKKPVNNPRPGASFCGPAANCQVHADHCLSHRSRTGCRRTGTGCGYHRTPFRPGGQRSGGMVRQCKKVCPLPVIATLPLCTGRRAVLREPGGVGTKDRAGHPTRGLCRCRAAVCPRGRTGKSRGKNDHRIAPCFADAPASRPLRAGAGAPGVRRHPQDHRNPGKRGRSHRPDCLYPCGKKTGCTGVMGASFRYARAILPLFGSEFVYCHTGVPTAEGQYSVKEFVALRKLLF